MRSSQTPTLDVRGILKTGAALNGSWNVQSVPGTVRAAFSFVQSLGTLGDIATKGAPASWPRCMRLSKAVAAYRVGVVANDRDEGSGASPVTADAAQDRTWRATGRLPREKSWGQPVCGVARPGSEANPIARCKSAGNTNQRFESVSKRNLRPFLAPRGAIQKTLPLPPTHGWEQLCQVSVFSSRKTIR